MKPAPLPPQEAERLAALHDYGILDTPLEAAFDALTRLAADICGVPIALISLVDHDRQWFKSAYGLSGVRETPREQAFCAHAILDPELMEVGDASTDPRFHDNPLVVDNPGIRFYAGMPLVNPEQHALGTLCVIDRQPKTLSADQRGALKQLSIVTMSLLEHGREQRRARQTLARQAAELAHINTELEQFAYVASHDLKAPLRGIANLALWIEEDLGEQLSADLRHKTTMLRGRVNRMETLLNDLLAYSRAGRTEAAVGPVDSGALVTELADLLQPPAGLCVVSAPDMPRFDTARAPLEQVLRNLIGNAIKHHDRGAGQIRVAAQDNGDHYTFSVTDDGPGIPAEFQHKIFQLFQTLKSRDQVEGSGMGLAICKKIVEQQGRTLSVESPLGERGTAFHFGWNKRWRAKDTRNDP